MRLFFLFFFLIHVHYVYGQLSRDVSIQIDLPLINTDSIVTIENEIKIIPKKNIDSNIRLFPIFFEENGLLQFINGYILDTLSAKKTYRLCFEIKQDTQNSTLNANDLLEVYFYETNHFGFDKNIIELHNDIQYEQFLKGKCTFSKKIPITIVDKWSSIIINLEKENMEHIKYFQIGISKSNKKNIIQMIHILSDGEKNDRDKMDFISKFKFSYHQKKTIDNESSKNPFTLAYLIKNIKIEENYK